MSEMFFIFIILLGQMNTVIFTSHGGCWCWMQQLDGRGCVDGRGCGGGGEGDDEKNKWVIRASVIVLPIRERQEGVVGRIGWDALPYFTLPSLHLHFLSFPFLHAWSCYNEDWDGVPIYLSICLSIHQYSCVPLSVCMCVC